MKQATTRRKETTGVFHLGHRLREAAFILLFSIAIYLLIALITYHVADPGWSHTGMGKDIHNAAGKTGAWFSDVLFSLFGYVAYLFPMALIISGVFIYREIPQSEEKNPMLWTIRSIGLLIALSASCGLIAMHFAKVTQTLPMTTGGLLGVTVQSAMVGYMNHMGATIMLLALFLTGTTLFTGMSWLQLVDSVLHWSFKKAKDNHVGLGEVLKKAISRANEIKSEIPWDSLPKLMSSSEPKKTKAPVTPKKRKSPIFEMEVEGDGDALFADEEERETDLPDNTLFKSKLKSATKSNEVDFLDEPFPAMMPRKAQVKESSGQKMAAKLKQSLTKTKPEKKASHLPHTLPGLGLLENAEKKQKQGYTSAQINELSRLVETRLLEFGVDAKVVGVYPGPVITRFELDLAAGIKVNKITGLAKDLARSLSVVSVRVVEVIPGKSVVGLEIPNTHRELVRLKEVLEDPNYQQAQSPLSLGLGKDISGKSVIVDLAKMPHLLVAGTTGSGKSVGVNAMLLSILFKSSPEEVRLIMIDPKMLELAIYDHIPHLLTPVVTDMKDAANALRWCVAEMERRYQLMAAVGVRNLAGYNAKVEAAKQSGKPLLDPFWIPQNSDKPDPLEKLPFIVVVVDEFADMIMVVGKKVEELIARIAQKARAAGIHLILATQRPSVDVITGLIKANIPTRIAFQVSSRIDSRTILDQSGAEQLLGFGDMLYLPPGVGVPHRIHGAFVSDEEVHRVVDDLRKLGKPTYIESVVQSTLGAVSGDDEDIDELYDQAVMVITQERKASISLIQRRLKIGYNRAARLIEQMEAQGVVSSVQSNGTREVLAPPPPE
jgi:S-DNA-T family DNA segregation ATPase FtsK/SpoIIIE